MKTNSQQGSLFRFKLSSKQFPLPTQFRPSPMTHYLFQSNAITTAVQTKDATWCIWEIKINIPKQAVSTFHLSLTPLSTNNLNTKFHCAFSAMTVTISLSQHSSTYTARQIIMLQASISRSPVSANIGQAPLLLHTTEPQVFNYSRLISQMWQLNQGHWQSKLDPPGSHANVSQMWQLNQGHRPSRLSCQLPSQMWQLNQGHRPSRLSCQRFSF